MNRITKILILSIILSYTTYSCNKKENFISLDYYKQDETFFKRKESMMSFFNQINTTTKSNIILDSIINKFKIYDKSYHIIEKIKNEYGLPYWDMSIVFNNTNGLNTIFTPIFNYASNLTSYIIFYQKENSRTYYKIIGKNSEQNNLPIYGNKKSSIFTKSSLSGLFDTFNNIYKIFSSTQSSRSQNSIIICWPYDWSEWDSQGNLTVGRGRQCASVDLEVESVGDGTLSGPGGDMSGGSGNSGNSYFSNLKNADTIIRKFDSFPCAKEILKELPNCNDDVKKILNDVFTVSSDINITFTIDSSLIGTLTDAHTASSGSPSNFSSTIRVNPDILTKSSREYIAATFIHEAIHSYVDYYYSRYLNGVIDSNEFKSKFLLFWNSNPVRILNANEKIHHEVMANNYTLIMRNYLLNFNPAMSQDVARGLAWGGLHRTDLWKLQSDTNQIKLINSSARDANNNQTFLLLNNLRKCD